jgi:hypothetical protein
LVRREVDEIVCVYAFDLQTNELTTKTIPNLHAGREHRFVAYRLRGEPTSPVRLRERRHILAELEASALGIDDE